MAQLHRRRFLFTLSGLLAGATLWASPRKKKNLIVHHMLFWLKNPESAEDKTRLMANLNTLKKIEYHRTLIGTPLAGAEFEGTDTSYDVSLVTYFDDITGRTAYENHPVHQEFIRESRQLWQKQVTYTTVCEIP